MNTTPCARSCKKNTRNGLLQKAVLSACCPLNSYGIEDEWAIIALVSIHEICYQSSQLFHDVLLKSKKSVKFLTKYKLMHLNVNGCSDQNIFLINCKN